MVPLRFHFNECGLTSWSAGVRDSALTVHGGLQAGRLGQHFARTGIRFTHISSSDLQRAYKTAEAVRLAQGCSNKGNQDTPAPPEVSRLLVLREQDLGSYEGKSLSARQRSTVAEGEDDYISRHRHDPEFKDVESKESMDARMNSFVMEHLVPLLPVDCSKDEAIFAIVSHGIILNHLWKCCRKLFSRSNITSVPGIEVRGGLEYLGGWSNTGYLELDIQRLPTEAPLDQSGNIQLMQPSPNKDTILPFLSLRMIVKAVNCTEHLKNLKRTRGGVGSATLDDGQKKIDSFFKRPRLGWAETWTGPVHRSMPQTGFLLPLCLRQNHIVLHTPHDIASSDSFGSENSTHNQTFIVLPWTSGRILCDSNGYALVDRELLISTDFGHTGFVSFQLDQDACTGLQEH